jgi:hypothetical protein
VSLLYNTLCLCTAGRLEVALWTSSHLSDQFMHCPSQTPNNNSLLAWRSSHPESRFVIQFWKIRWPKTHRHVEHVVPENHVAPDHSVLFTSGDVPARRSSQPSRSVQ